MINTAAKVINFQPSQPAYTNKTRNFKSKTSDKFIDQID